jgi:hypothetical protein
MRGMTSGLTILRMLFRWLSVTCGRGQAGDAEEGRLMLARILTGKQVAALWVGLKEESACLDQIASASTADDLIFEARNH